MASTVSFSLASRRRRRAWRFLATAGLVIGLLFILLPIFWLLETAFQKPRDAFTIPPHFIFLPTLENFRSLIQGQFADPCCTRSSSWPGAPPSRCCWACRGLRPVQVPVPGQPRDHGLADRAYITPA